jgi:hypothetical protein
MIQLSEKLDHVLGLSNLAMFLEADEPPLVPGTPPADPAAAPGAPVATEPKAEPEAKPEAKPEAEEPEEPTTIYLIKVSDKEGKQRPIYIKQDNAGHLFASEGMAQEFLDTNIEPRPDKTYEIKKVQVPTAPAAAKPGAPGAPGAPAAAGAATAPAKPAKPTKVWPGDYIWHIVNRETGKALEKNTETGTPFRSEADAFKFIERQGGDPKRYEIKQVPNPKSLTRLKETKKPLENGWTEQEVIDAMMPRVYSQARKHANMFGFARDTKQELDMRQEGILAILRILKGKKEDGVTPLDTGESPFGVFVERELKNAILRYAISARSSIPGMKRTGKQREEGIVWEFPPGTTPEMAARFKGQKMGFAPSGALLGYRIYGVTKPTEKDPQGEVISKDFPSNELEAAKAYRRELQKRPDVIVTQFKKRMSPIPLSRSMSQKVGGAEEGGEGEGTELGKVLGDPSTVGPRAEQTPAAIAAQKDQIERLIRRARVKGLSTQQEKVVRLVYGLDPGTPELRTGGLTTKWREEEPHEPGQQAGITPDPTKRVERSQTEMRGGIRTYAEVGQMMTDEQGNPKPMTGARVKQLHDRAVELLIQAAREVMPQYYERWLKSQEEAEPAATPAAAPAATPAVAPATEDEKMIEALVIVERKLRTCLIESYLINTVTTPLFEAKQRKVA